MKILILGFILAQLAFFSSCSNNLEIYSPSSAPLSPSNPLISGTPLAATATPTLVATVPRAILDFHENYALVIQKKALGQLFLMSPTIIDSAPVPIGDMLAPKIVFFARQGDKIFLFESPKGKMSSTSESGSFPTAILLAAFPILKDKETEKEIVFDFNVWGDLGLFQSGRFVHDAPKDMKKYLFQIQSSFVRQVKLVGEYLVIQQDVHGIVNQTLDSVSIKYSFSVYHPNPYFAAKLAYEEKKVGINSSQKEGFNKTSQIGFFENAPLLKPGSSLEQNFIMKRTISINRPIIFYISRNTPQELHTPITDGVLYWNKVLGKEFLKVEVLPEGVSDF
ncbi:MAG: hypothetical protein WCG27_01325, partial [Pseudomonadota bacterium]